MISQLYIYISDSVDPYKNLATEKFLLDSTPADACTLYLWQNQNTVVIGRNQNPWAECRLSLLESEGGKLARRLSGGGAVFHDLGNLNFTFLCSTENYDLTRQLQVIQTACQLAGITTEVSGRNDILADGKKFSGNAFYNSKGKSYHHGTLLVCADMDKIGRYLTPPKAKLEAKGVKSVKSRVVNLSQLSPSLSCEQMAGHMINSFEQVYNLKPVLLKNIDNEEILNTASKYGSWNYLYGSRMPFSVSCENRFSWGNIELQLQISEGIIQAARVYTDSMDWTLAESVQSALNKCILKAEPIGAALLSNMPKAIADDILSIIKTQLL